MKRCNWLDNLVISLCLMLTLSNLLGQAKDQTPLGIEKTDQVVEEVLASESPPWYDAKAKKIKSVLPQSQKTTTTATSSPSPSNPVSSSGDSFWLSFWEFLGKVVGWLVFVLIFVIIAAALVALLVHLGIIDLTKFKRRPEITPVAEKEVITIEQLEALPAVARDDRSLLDEASECVDDGNYEQAMVFYFSYQLLCMDRAEMLTLAKGKTNRRYLREVTEADRSWRTFFSDSIELFERAFFGKQQIDRDEFIALWVARDKISKLKPKKKTRGDDE